MPSQPAHPFERCDRTTTSSAKPRIGAFRAVARNECSPAFPYSLSPDSLAGLQPGSIESPKRQQLERIRALAIRVVPNAEETISYKMPTLTYQGKPFLGFNAHAAHIGIYPFSGSVIPQLHDELRAYAVSKSAIRVPLDRPISKRLLKLVITCRLRAIRAELSDGKAARRVGR